MESQDLVAELVTQLNRTADFLRSCPVTRLERGRPAATDQAREIADRAVVITRAVADVDGPPPAAQLPRVATHGLGDLLAVLAGELARGPGVRLAATGQDPDLAHEIAALASACIELRRTT